MLCWSDPSCTAIFKRTWTLLRTPLEASEQDEGMESAGHPVSDAYRVWIPWQRGSKTQPDPQRVSHGKQTARREISLGLGEALTAAFRRLPVLQHPMASKLVTS